jgi:hypothetical protein
MYIIVCIAGLIVVFASLCIVCDEHLVPAVEVFIKQFNVPEEVSKSRIYSCSCIVSLGYIFNYKSHPSFHFSHNLIGRCGDINSFWICCTRDNVEHYRRCRTRLLVVITISSRFCYDCLRFDSGFSSFVFPAQSFAN